MSLLNVAIKLPKDYEDKKFEQILNDVEIAKEKYNKILFRPGHAVQARGVNTTSIYIATPSIFSW